MSQNNISLSGSFLDLYSITAEKVSELLKSNCTVGEKIETDGICVIPISKVSAGFAGGGADIKNDAKKKSQSPAGTGAKISVTPVTLLIFENGTVRLENISVAKSGGITKAVQEFIRLQKNKSAAK